MRPEVGISFMPTHDPHKLTSNAIETGRHPFDRIAIYDDMGFPPPMIQLAEFARFTETASIGPEGIPIAKLNPDEVIGDITFLENLRPGNVFLGLVPGAWMEKMGLETANLSQMRDAIGVIEYLNQNGTKGYPAEAKQRVLFQVANGFQLQYPTPKDIPIVIGAHGPKMLELAGELESVKGIKLGGTANPDRVDLARDRLIAGAKRSGRNPREIGIVLGSVTVVDKDGIKAMEYAKPLALPYIDDVGELDPIVKADKSLMGQVRVVKDLIRQGDTYEAVRAIPNELARLFIVAGTPDQVTEHVLQIVKAGGSFEFGTPHGVNGKNSLEAEVSAIKLLGEEVLPSLKQEIDKLNR